LLISLPGFVNFADLEAEGSHIDEDLRGDNHTRAAILGGGEDAEGVLIVDDGRLGVQLVEDLTNFQVCLVVLRIQLNHSLEELHALTILTKTALGLC
jgi:hypothetical protein